MPSDENAQCESGTEREMVHVAGRSNGGGGSRKVHTDRNCPGLKEARAVLDRPREVLTDDIDYCRICTGEMDHSDQDQDHSHYNALVAAAEEADNS